MDKSTQDEIRKEQAPDAAPNRTELLHLIKKASEKECEIILQFAVHLLKQ